MGGRQRDPQRPARCVTGKHHDNERGIGFFGEVLRMTGEMHARLIDDTFMHGRGRHRSKLAAAATGECAIEEIEHIAAIAGIEFARLGRRGEWYMDDRQAAAVNRKIRRKRGQANRQAERLGTRCQQIPVAQNDGLRITGKVGQTQAEFGADTGRFAAGDGDDRAHYFSSSRFST